MTGPAGRQDAAATPDPSRSTASAVMMAVIRCSPIDSTTFASRASMRRRFTGATLAMIRF